MVWVRERFGPERVSERGAYRVLGQARSTQRRVRQIPKEEAQLVIRMVELASQYGRTGYRRITAMLRWEGWKVNHKRVERLWRQEGLKVPSRQPKRRRLWLHDGSCVRLRPTHRNKDLVSNVVGGLVAGGRSRVDNVRVFRFGPPSDSP